MTIALLDAQNRGRTVRAGIIGTGHFATAVVTQSRAIPRLEVVAAADLDLEAARRAFRLAGWAPEEVCVCESRSAALAALERGQRVIVQDAMLLVELPLDVVVESTGLAEAAAVNALAAIAHGKHVAMVNKEADVCVGPMLKHLANAAGLVYSAVDGDQHGLLMGHVAWVRSLGLSVLCGGKSRDAELVYDGQAATVASDDATLQLTTDQAAWFAPIPAGGAREYVAARLEILQGMGAIGGYDVVELTIAANATGLAPDAAQLHCPPIRINEIPEALCPASEGGILAGPERVDAVSVLRGAAEAGLGGGVFAVVGCENDYSRYILTTKGCLSNAAATAVLIHHPHHLCGVETATTILAAGLLGQPTGARDYAPRYDVVARANRDLLAGEVVGDDHSPDLTALMAPARALASDAPIPLHMARGNRLACAIPAGTVISAGMVSAPERSPLWELRRRQDRYFGL